MSDDSQDFNENTPSPRTPVLELANEAWAKANRSEQTLTRWRQFLFGSKETGPGWVNNMDTRIQKVEAEQADQKFLIWKIVAASALGGGFVALAFNLIKLLS